MALKKLKNDSNAAKDPCWKEKLGKAFNEAKDLMTYLKTQVASPTKMNVANGISKC